MSNRLAGEQSPYLIQHKDNPVDWYPWSSDAFEAALRQDKPIFLSIGYSTCHWCHVMAHESFEDEEVAHLMNETFISIKVDREERPDVDGVYMTVCQMMTGQGGWPLSIFMTPDRKPFHAATFIPKDSRYGRLGMLDLIPRIQEVWRSQRQDVLDSAEHVTSVLRSASKQTEAGEYPDETVLTKAYEELEGRYDSVYGGFGTTPKFPSPSNFFFLLRYARRHADSSALEMVTHTLRQMRLGGIYDHLGFGFHRYSTDRHWLLPHFEKMLYDQAMLALAYTEAYQSMRDETFVSTAEEIFTYVLRDLLSPEGAFYSAEDADSEGQEGKFYVWTVEEVQRHLSPEDAQLIIDVYNVSEEGNFEEEATRKRTGENILHLKEPIADVAGSRGDDPGELSTRLAASRRRLFLAREKRVRPGLDDKILSDWNGLMIVALSRAAAVFDRADYAAAARRCVDFIRDRMLDSHGRLLHRYREGDAGVPGNLDDYAYVVWGLLEFYEVTFELSALRLAVDLTDDLLEHFWDEEHGGFFFTADDSEQLIARRKEFFDGALPSGNAIAMLNLLRLNRLTARTNYQDRADAIARAAGVSKMPSGFTALLSAVDFAIGPSSEVVLAGKRGSAEIEAMLKVLRVDFMPNKVVLLHEDGDLKEIAPYVEGQQPLDGQAAAYVCRDFQCERPVTSPEELRAILNR